MPQAVARSREAARRTPSTQRPSFDRVHGSACSPDSPPAVRPQRVLASRSALAMSRGFAARGVRLRDRARCGRLLPAWVAAVPVAPHSVASWRRARAERSPASVACSPAMRTPDALSAQRLATSPSVLALSAPAGPASEQAASGAEIQQWQPAPPVATASAGEVPAAERRQRPRAPRQRAGVGSRTASPIPTTRRPKRSATS